MRAVDAVIRRRLASDVVLISQVAEYIINAGGKRLRPVVLLLSAGACGYRGPHHYELAAVVEFIHTATLLHDDVVDESELRRGRQTANAVFGNAASVLVGDFLYSRAFQMMVPEPTRSPLYQPLSIGPTESAMAGMSTVAAAIRHAGVVLSHPMVSTTPSSG